MATLATIANVRSEGNLPSSSKIADAILQTFLDTAVIEMKRLLTSDVYTAVVAEASTVQRKIDCTKAEAILAFAHAIPSLNVETSGTGIVSVKGWDQSRSEVLSVTESERLSDLYRSKAMMLIGPWLPVVEAGDDDDDQVSVGTIAMVAV